MAKTGCRAILTLALILLAAAPAWASDLFLDPSFHFPDGYLTWDGIGTGRARGEAATFQPDGKIVVLGTTIVGSKEEMILVRFGVEGGFDPAFGAGKGYIVHRAGSGWTVQPAGIALQTDSGKLLVAATQFDEDDGTSDIVLLRYNSDGTPDVSFGGGTGSVVFGYQDYKVNICHDLLLLPDGRIVVVSLEREKYFMLVPLNEVFLFRRMADGSPDLSLGGGVGAVRTAVPPGELIRLAAQAGGMLMASSLGSNGLPDLLISRFDHDGGADPAFGGGAGSVRLPEANLRFDLGFDLAVYEGGKIAACSGEKLWRLTPAGMPDTSFGGGTGVVTIPASTQRLAIQGDKLLVAGMVGHFNGLDPFAEKPFLARFGPDGAPDPGFHGGEFLIFADRGRSFAVLARPDGRMVALGNGQNGGDDLEADLILAAGLDVAGAPDPRFNGGVVPADFSFAETHADDDAQKVALQPDGKIVVVGFSRDPESLKGRLVLQRYFPDGRPDTSFGETGTTIYDGQRMNPYALAIQPADGKILVAGTRSNRYVWPDIIDRDVFVLRFTAAGALDDSFGQSGLAIFGGPWREEAWSLMVQPDGKILVGGDYFDGSASSLLLLRFNDNGTLDGSFGASGVVLREDYPESYLAALGTDGKLVAIGYEYYLAGDSGYVLLRYNNDGTPDQTFGDGGLVRTAANPLNRFDNPYDLKVQPDGKILAAGTRVTYEEPAPGFWVPRYNGLLVRFNSDGMLDSGFGGGDGVVEYDTLGDEVLAGIALAADGGIAAVGTVNLQGLFVLVTDESGQPDPDFGVGGVIPFSGRSAIGMGVAWQPDGKIVVAGGVWGTNGFPSYLQYDLLLARFKPRPAGATGANILKVAPLTLTPAAGTYTAARTVTIASPTEGALIRYTTDGTTPSAAVGTELANGGTVSVDRSLILKAIAYKPGWTPTAVVSALYALKVLPVTFTPPPGRYSTPQTVTIASPTEGALIRYTTDGTMPSAAVGMELTNGGAVAVDRSLPLKAIAYKPGWIAIAVVNALYTLKVEPVTVTPGSTTSLVPQTVKILTSTADALIRYTTDGTMPSAAVGMELANGGTVSVDRSLILKAIACKSGWTPTAVVSALYALKVLPVTLTPAPGRYFVAQTVTIASPTKGALIRYTTDGTTPSAAVGTELTNGGAIAVDRSLPLKAIAYKPGWIAIAVVNALYTLKVEPVTITPGSTTSSVPQTVKILTPTAGALIRYTTDGTMPSAAVGMELTNGGTVSVDRSLILKAIAYKPGWTPTAVVSALFALKVLPVTLTPAPGRYFVAQTVTITSPTKGALIRYTTDGTWPSAAVGTELTNGGSVLVDRSLPLKAISYKEGWTSSTVISGTYTF